MRRLMRYLPILVAAFALSACGLFGDSSGPSEGIQPKAGSVDIHKNGVAASLYIIGSCDGSDDPGNNVVSSGAANGILKAPGKCPGSPFNISATKIDKNTYRIVTFVGPAVTDYKTMSIPLDTVGKVSEKFSFAGNSYYVGCANNWSGRSGSWGFFSQIPTPCYISGAGPVGAARTGRGVEWGEISGPVTIRRTRIGGSCSELFFHEHPHTRNIEWDIGPLYRGQQVGCEEDLHIE